MEPEAEAPPVKQVIVIRRDLRMRRGKECAQAAHAAMIWLSDRLRHGRFRPGHSTRSIAHFTTAELLWLQGTFRKIVCQVDTMPQLVAIQQAAKEAGVMAYLCTDVGDTEFHGKPTATALAIGPDYASRIDPITKDLKLY